MVRQKSGGEMDSPTPSIDSLNGVSVAASGGGGGGGGTGCGDQLDSHCSGESSGLGTIVSSRSNSGNTGASHSPLSAASSSSSDRSSSSGSSSGLGSSPLAASMFNSSSTKCSVCAATFVRPKVLQCFHTFCQVCLEKIQDHPDKITCPQCHADCSLGGGGVGGLISDFGVVGLMESAAAVAAATTTGGGGLAALADATCTGCKSRDSVFAVARCFDCQNFLCPQCVTAHQYMHCFDGHHVTTLGELTSKAGGLPHGEIEELDVINRIVQDGKTHAQDIRVNLKNLETTSKQLQGHYSKAQAEINETFQFYAHQLEERKNELQRELDGLYSSKQVSISVFSQKAQDTVDKIYQVTDFVERLMKHASNGEVLRFKRLLENKFITLLNNPTLHSDMSPGSLCDFEFISNFAAIQVGVKNSSGYIRSRNDSGSGSMCNMAVGKPPQPPISRPAAGNGGGGGALHRPAESAAAVAAQQSALGLSQLINTATGHGASNNGLNNGFGQGLLSAGGGGQQQTHVNNTSVSVSATATQLANSLSMNGMQVNPGLMIERQHQYLKQNLNSGGVSSVQVSGGGSSAAGTHSPMHNGPSNGFGDGGFLSNRFVATGGLGSLMSGTTLNELAGGLNAQLSAHHLHAAAQTVAATNAAPASRAAANGSAVNPYEKWSTGSDKLMLQLNGGLGGGGGGANGSAGPTSLNGNGSVDSWGDHKSDSLLDSLSSKLLSSSGMNCSSSMGVVGGGCNGGSNVSVTTTVGSGGGGSGGSGPPMFPPKSQIKRQKMIYHCKFGEFGVLEGQFTEPSGVAVNAQNDIIVADTNNHRIQIFDKEGRFKFQFGECGKRDGQLLYPNRVAVVRQSGDIVVTERSPTHQVQIYNQYGQFVRKFGANILQHPRGVCVDNKGRIIVVECKVMRVIIFDQLGNVLNKFGCSKHLEFPNGVVVNDRQEIFISDNRAHCVKVFNYEGSYLRQIGGEAGVTNYPIGVGINAAGEVTIADNHNNFNLTVFNQDGQLLSALESKVKHAQCFDVALMDDGSVVLASKDYRLYIYRYVQIPPIGLQ